MHGQLRQHLRDCASEAAGKVMLLHGNDQVKFLRAADDRLAVDGLYRRECPDRRMNAVPGEDRFRTCDLLKDRAGRKNGDPAPAVDRNGSSDLEMIDMVMDPLFAAAAQPQIAGTGIPRDRPCGFLCLHKIAGTQHRHIRQRPHHGDVLCRLMAHAKRPIDKAAAHAHDLHIGVMIRAVVADLLQTAQRWKIADGIGKHGFSLERHSGRRRGHILLRNTGVDELIGQLLPEGLEHPEAKIAGHKLDIRIFFCKRDQRADKGISHTQTSFAIYVGCQPAEAV